MTALRIIMLIALVIAIFARIMGNRAKKRADAELREFNEEGSQYRETGEQRKV